MKTNRVYRDESLILSILYSKLMQSIYDLIFYIIIFKKKDEKKKKK